MILVKDQGAVQVGFKLNDENKPIDGIDYFAEGDCDIFFGEYNEDQKINHNSTDDWR